MRRISFDNEDETTSKKPKERDTTAERAKRDNKGRFGAGNTLGRGNPVAVMIARYREGIVKGATPEDLRDIIRKLVKLAKKGDIAAARVVLDRLLGEPIAADVWDEMAAMRRQIEELLSQRKL